MIDDKVGKSDKRRDEAKMEKRKSSRIAYEKFERRERRKSAQKLIAIFRKMEIGADPERQAKEELGSKVADKIKKRADEFGVGFREALEQCVSAPILAAMQFGVDPKRTSLHQRLCGQYLRKWLEARPDREDRGGVLEPGNFEMLTSAGPKALYLVNGVVLDAANAAKSKSKGKSIDAKWVYRHPKAKETMEFFATMKYTKDEGGAQDNQREDASWFVKEAGECASHSQLFFAILDGAHYEKASKQRSREDGRLLSRREVIDASGAGKCRAARSHEVPGICASAIREYLKRNKIEPEEELEAALRRMERVAMDPVAEIAGNAAGEPEGAEATTEGKRSPGP